MHILPLLIIIIRIINITIIINCRSHWPSGLRHGSADGRLRGLWVRIPPRAWMFVCSKYCVLSGRGLCDGLITCPEDSYRLWCVLLCDHVNSRMRKLKLARVVNAR